MKILKILFWTLCLTPDWYFIRLDDDKVLRPAYWNGYVWESRLGVIEDNRVRSVLGRVPHPVGA